MVNIARHHRSSFHRRALNRRLNYGAVALLLLVSFAMPAEAQIGGGRGHGQRDQQQQGQKRSAVPSGSIVIPQVWPRLDEGAVLCKSRDDLVSYQRQLGAGASGSAPSIAGCRTLQKQTGIQILDHDGPSRSQVVTTDDAKETGWTNAYLPATPPAAVVKGSTAGK